MLPSFSNSVNMLHGALQESECRKMAHSLAKFREDRKFLIWITSYLEEVKQLFASPEYFSLTFGSFHRNACFDFFFMSQIKYNAID